MSSSRCGARVNGGKCHEIQTNLTAAICAALAILSAPIPGRAVVINSGDVITASLNVLPSATVFDDIAVEMIFGTNVFVGSVTFSLFNSGNSLVTQRGIPLFGGFGLTFGLSGPVDNNGYLVLDPIVGPFDLVELDVQGGIVTHFPDGSSSERFTDAVATQFEVTPLPAALPLFVTGLGALGLLGWRRKRKQAA